jgi:Uma2 family endonuclease
MNIALLKPVMTRDQFFLWAQAQDARYEFDGIRPVAMTGGTMSHSEIIGNILSSIKPRLKGTGCRVIGPDAGVATVGDAVRYPDAVITCRKVDGDSYLVPEPSVVFEVQSHTSGYTDRIVKMREYQAVPSIRRYVIVESRGIGLTVLERTDGAHPWTSFALTGADVVRILEAGIEVSVAEFYEGLDIVPADGQG